MNVWAICTKNSLSKQVLNDERAQEHCLTPTKWMLCLYLYKTMSLLMLIWISTFHFNVVSSWWQV